MWGEMREYLEKQRSCELRFLIGGREGCGVLEHKDFRRMASPQRKVWCT